MLEPGDKIQILGCIDDEEVDEYDCNVCQENSSEYCNWASAIGRILSIDDDEAFVRLESKIEGTVLLNRIELVEKSLLAESVRRMKNA